ncbi:MAG TPA: hypothetical protein VEV17_16390 [Bryobacteraceae bacterium]|nr:hypothetical protein [Bryobacteraceae bacterium]
MARYEVVVTGASQDDAGNLGSFRCAKSADALTLTIPAAITSTMPPSSQDPTTGLYNGFVSINVLPKQPLTVSVPNLAWMPVSSVPGITVYKLQYCAQAATSAAGNAPEKSRAQRTR